MKIENKYDFDMYWKSYRYLREDLEITDNEFQELLDYFIKEEKYEICGKLKIKNNHHHNDKKNL